VTGDYQLPITNHQSPVLHVFAVKRYKIDFIITYIERLISLFFRFRILSFHKKVVVKRLQTIRAGGVFNVETQASKTGHEYLSFFTP
jgi:hypothetical protein